MRILIDTKHGWKNTQIVTRATVAVIPKQRILKRTFADIKMGETAFLLKSYAEEWIVPKLIDVEYNNIRSASGLACG